MLNFIKRNLGKCTNKVKSKAYASLVRPIVAGISPKFETHTRSLEKSLIYKIERNRDEEQGGFSNYDFHSSVSSKLC